MAERDLAVVAGEEVQAEEHDGVDPHLGELEEAEPAQEKRQEDGDHEQAETADEARARVRDRHAGYTRRITARPNRPLGRTRRTTMMMTRATVSFSSVPMNGM